MVIWCIFVIFEDFTTKLIISDLSITCISSSDKRLHMVGDWHIMLRQRLLESIWTNVTSSQFPNLVTQFLLLLGREPVVSSQVHIWRAQASQRSRLVVYGCILVLLWINVHVTLFDLTPSLVCSLLGQRLDKALGSDLLRSNLSALVHLVAALFVFLPSLVADW